MLQRVKHLIPVIMCVKEFLTYVMSVLRCGIWGNTSYSSYKVYSEVSKIRYACHKVCRIE